jgi:nucleoside-diphosphate-sugar epimerase
VVASPWTRTVPTARRKLPDVSRLTALGWRAQVALRDGIAETYATYRRALETSAARLAKIA